MVRRNKLEMCLDILRVCRGNGKIKTRIMYGANINMYHVMLFLFDLIKLGFLKAYHADNRSYDYRGTKSNRGFKYVTTIKGVNIIKRFDDLFKEFPFLEKRSNG